MTAHNKLLAWLIVPIWILLYLTPQCSCDCGPMGLCNGHGQCKYPQRVCECYEGWGSSSDIATFKSLTCAQQTCPSGKSWGDIPTSKSAAHGLAECSDRGWCNRATGTCECFRGFTGASCNRMICPSASEGVECSGHGKCMSMQSMATTSEAMPIGPNTIYGYFLNSSKTWDDKMAFGCVCDSSWPVGLGYGETQEAEWFGADCSQRHCPSGDDPQTLEVVETNCTGVANKTLHEANRTAGSYGNLCHVDCSNRGICDHSSGICNCFRNFYGVACELTSALAENSVRTTFDG